jgi:ribonuclease P protein component
VGFVVPKSGHSSVERNLLKRRLRELSRTRLLPGAPPVDIVIRTRRDTYAVSFDALERDVVRVEQELRRRFAGAAATPPAALPATPGAGDGR